MSKISSTYIQGILKKNCHFKIIMNNTHYLYCHSYHNSNTNTTTNNNNNNNNFNNN